MEKIENGTDDQKTPGITDLGLDLAKLDTRKAANKGVQMNLLSPLDGSELRDKNGNPFYLIVLGADSDAYRALRQQQQDKVFQNPRLRNLGVSSNLLEQQVKDRVAAAIIGFSDNLVLNGKRLEYSEESVRELLEFSWVLDQAFQFIEDRANFLPK